MSRIVELADLLNLENNSQKRIRRVFVIGRSVCSTTASVLQIPTTTTTPPPPPPPIIPNRREMREVL